MSDPDRVQRWFQPPVIVAALASVPVTLFEASTPDPRLHAIADSLNWLIWSVFVVEYLVMLSVSRHRLAYTRRAWLNLLVVVVSFPVFPHVLGYSRLALAGRLIPIIVRGVHTLSRLLNRRGFGYMCVTFGIVALFSSALFALFEGDSLTDGIWWTIVTLTTVGYGDVVPTTPEGRIVAGLLMIGGIGLVAFITAHVAALFVEDDEDREDIRARLERIEQLLEELRKK